MSEKKESQFLFKKELSIVEIIYWLTIMEDDLRNFKALCDSEKPSACRKCIMIEICTNEE